VVEKRLTCHVFVDLGEEIRGGIDPWECAEECGGLTKLFALSGTGRAVSQVILDDGTKLRGELAIEVGGEMFANGFALHDTRSLSFSRNNRRARWRRDFTVPAGMPVTCAISP